MSLHAALFYQCSLHVDTTLLLFDKVDVKATIMLQNLVIWFAKQVWISFNIFDVKLLRAWLLEKFLQNSLEDILRTIFWKVPFKDSKDIGKMARTNVHSFEKIINKLVFVWIYLQTKFLVHHSIVFLRVKLFKIVIDKLFQNWRWDYRVHGLGETDQVPFDNFRLSSITVPFVVIGSIRDVVFGKIVNKGERSVVYGQIN